jgi:GT2 family glycosyltransferase
METALGNTGRRGDQLIPMTANSSLPRVSVVIPTHNPRMDYLRRVLEALRGQTLAKGLWELVIVDNGSRLPLKAGAGQQDNRSAGPQNCGTSLPSHIPTLPPSTAHLDLSWHQNARIVREEKLGLTFARLRGFAEVKGELIVMVDDDNVLAPDYLETTVRIAQAHPELGAFGGKCLPEFEVEPERWLASVTSGLGLRDLGEAPQLFPREHTADGIRHEDGDRRPEVGEQRPDDMQLAEFTNTEPRLGETAQGAAEGKHRVTRRVTEFPDCAPIGAGMVLRREAAAAYAERIQQRTTGPRDHGTTGRSEDGGRRTEDEALPKNRAESARQREAQPRAITEPPNYRAASVITDRRGDSLASGGDNDICLTVLEAGWQVGYFPQLRLTHLIPKQRMTLDYQRRMARESMRSFILMLDQHGIRPWVAIPPWSVSLRVVKDWLRVQPWRDETRCLRWSMNRGRYEACGRLK